MSDDLTTNVPLTSHELSALLCSVYGDQSDATLDAARETARLKLHQGLGDIRRERAWRIQAERAARHCRSLPGFGEEGKGVPHT